MAAMGIGEIGENNRVFKRKFRWDLQITAGNGEAIGVDYVKTAERPKLQIEKTQIDFRNETTWIPGKARWQPINVVYYDVPSESMTKLYTWILDIYDWEIAADRRQTEKIGWTGTAVLNMYDGCGEKLEEWTLTNVFPENINWQNLDYTSSDIQTVDLTLVYSDVKYRSFCNTQPSAKVCKGCVPNESTIEEFPPT